MFGTFGKYLFYLGDCHQAAPHVAETSVECDFKHCLLGQPRNISSYQLSVHSDIIYLLDITDHTAAAVSQSHYSLCFCPPELIIIIIIIFDDN